MLKGSILIIDDEPKLRSALSRIIELEGYRVCQADNSRKGLQILEQQKDISLVITDVRLPDMNGIQLLEKIKEQFPSCEVIVITAYGTIQDGVRAMKIGAFDYVTKGDGDDQILVTIERAIEKAKMQRRILDLENKLKTRYSFEQIFGNSKVIKETISLARKVAPTDSTVLLEGETGTGKELFAQSIHNASPRRSKPFIAVNCSAFPKDLLESEVFGYKKGAFTGANIDKKGLFAEAHEGTLFLDEIGDMDLGLQAKLLRVLEDQSFTRIGDTKPVKVDVRIIAATNRDLLHEAHQEHFRTDLYYRLSGFKIVVPPLRDRKEDLADLANHFIRFYSNKTNKKISGMDEGFFRKLKEYDWPGNTRELKNMIERAVILADKELLSVDLLPYEIVKANHDTSFSSFEGTIEELEKMHIRKILSITGGNKTKAAEILGIGIPTLYRKIDKFGLE
jgi:two-component system, NtrC family, response regulator